MVHKLATKVSQHADFKNFAAVTIQRFWRGFRDRKRYLQMLQARQEVTGEKEQQREVLQEEHSATVAIQRAWRSYSDRRIYYYYRDLIKLKERTDPRLLLRSMNPRESELMDAASGLHVRFRLGGTTFPPLIFYKIFTHRPVTDICSFCPRFYAGELPASPAQLHNSLTAGKQKRVAVAASYRSLQQEEPFNIDASLREYIKPNGQVGYRSLVGWYRRYENNGWRPVADRFLAEEESVTSLTSQRRTAWFHHVPAVRLEQRQKHLKERKRQWMVRLYQSGLIHQGSALDSLGNMDGGSPDIGDDQGEEDLDLLEWTEALDFDCYVDQWKYMACTMGSEAFIPELETPYLEDLPTVSLNFSEAMASKGVAAAPFKGSATAAGGFALHLS